MTKAASCPSRDMPIGRRIIYDKKNGMIPGYAGKRNKFSLVVDVVVVIVVVGIVVAIIVVVIFVVVLLLLLLLLSLLFVLMRSGGLPAYLSLNSLSSGVVSHSMLFTCILFSFSPNIPFLSNLIRVRRTDGRTD